MYVRRYIESLYHKLALCNSKTVCGRTDTVFFTISEVSNGTVSLTRYYGTEIQDSVVQK